MPAQLQLLHFLSQQKPLMLSAGIITVAHLRHSLQMEQQQLLNLDLRSGLSVLPPAWRAVVSSAPAASWFQGFLGLRQTTNS